MKMYRAALLYGRETVRVEWVPVPLVEAREVLVRIHRANLCPTDLKKYYHLDSQAEATIHHSGPLILGHEAAGTVIEVGSEVTSFRKGDRVAIDPLIPCQTCVYCRNGDFPSCLHPRAVGAAAGSVAEAVKMLTANGIGGCFAELVKVPAANLIAIPDDLSFAAASLMEPLADVLHSVEVAAAQPDEVAAVFGLGAMGLLHVQALVAKGVERVVGIDPLERRRALAATMGALQTIDPTTSDPVEALKSMSDGIGPHVIFVASGGEAQKVCAREALAAVRKRGRVLLFASATPPAEVPVNLNAIHYGAIVLTGTVGFYRRHALRALRLLAEGKIDVAAIRSPTYKLEAIAEAFARYGAPDVLKVGLDIVS